MIERHEPLVTIIRKRIVPTVPCRIDAEDLEAEGRLALVRAVDRYDVDRGVRFTAFCISMLRGSMLEYLRQEDWVPRSLRRKERRLRRAEEAVERSGQSVTAERLAEVLSLDLAALYQLQREATPYETIAFDEVMLSAAMRDAEPLITAEGLADPAPGPETVVLRRTDVRRAVRLLRGVRAQVIKEYYYTGRTLKEIARQINRSESRAHQIHNDALRLLREELEETMGQARGRLCAGKPDGSPCGASAVSGSDHCYYHQREERMPGANGDCAERVEPSRMQLASLAPFPELMPSPAPLSEVDAELVAMSVMARQLLLLEERARARVLRWVADRFEGVGR